MNLPETHDTPEFRKKWDEWVAYRRSRRLAKYKTDRVLINLCRFPVSVAIKAIDNSLNNEYQGLFPEKFGHESVARDQRLGRHIQRGGRAEPPKDKYAGLDEGTPFDPGEEDTGEASAA